MKLVNLIKSVSWDHIEIEMNRVCSSLVKEHFSKNTSEYKVLYEKIKKMTVDDNYSKYVAIVTEEDHPFEIIRKDCDSTYNSMNKDILEKLEVLDGQTIQYYFTLICLSLFHIYVNEREVTKSANANNNPEEVVDILNKEANATRGKFFAFHENYYHNFYSNHITFNGMLLWNSTNDPRVVDSNGEYREDLLSYIRSFFNDYANMVGIVNHLINPIA